MPLVSIMILALAVPMVLIVVTTFMASLMAIVMAFSMMT
jgi:hypothetical protein